MSLSMREVCPGYRAFDSYEPDATSQRETLKILRAFPKQQRLERLIIAQNAIDSLAVLQINEVNVFAQAEWIREQLHQVYHKESKSPLLFAKSHNLSLDDLRSYSGMHSRFYDAIQAIRDGLSTWKKKSFHIDKLVHTLSILSGHLEVYPDENAKAFVDATICDICLRLIGDADSLCQVNGYLSDDLQDFKRELEIIERNEQRNIGDVPKRNRAIYSFIIRLEASLHLLSGNNLAWARVTLLELNEALDSSRHSNNALLLPTKDLFNAESFLPKHYLNIARSFNEPHKRRVLDLYENTSSFGYVDTQTRELLNLFLAIPDSSSAEYSQHRTSFCWMLFAAQQRIYFLKIQNSFVFKTKLAKELLLELHELLVCNPRSAIITFYKIMAEMKINGGIDARISEVIHEYLLEREHIIFDILAFSKRPLWIKSLDVCDQSAVNLLHIHHEYDLLINDHESNISVEKPKMKEFILEGMTANYISKISTQASDGITALLQAETAFKEEKKRYKQSIRQQSLHSADPCVPLGKSLGLVCEEGDEYHLSSFLALFAFGYSSTDGLDEIPNRGNPIYGLFKHSLEEYRLGKYSVAGRTLCHLLEDDSMAIVLEKLLAHSGAERSGWAITYYNEYVEFPNKKNVAFLEGNNKALPCHDDYQLVGVLTRDGRAYITRRENNLVCYDPIGLQIIPTTRIFASSPRGSVTNCYPYISRCDIHELKDVSWSIALYQRKGEVTQEEQIESYTTIELKQFREKDTLLSKDKRQIWATLKRDGSDFRNEVSKRFCGSTRKEMFYQSLIPYNFGKLISIVKAEEKKRKTCNK